MGPPQRRGDGNSVKTRDVGILGIGMAIGLTSAAIFGVGRNSNFVCPMEFGADKSQEIVTASTKKGSHRKQPLFLPTGMNPIYSYYGKLDHLTDPIPTTWWLETSDKHKDDKTGSWFSQHGQDVAVAKFFNFKRDGFFVDLAANDAVWASNTFSLEQNFGWKGICIEPNPQYWYRLSFRNCNVVGAIVGGSDNVEVDVVLGQAHQGPYGGIVGEDFDNKQQPKKKENSGKRYTIALSTVLEMFDAPQVIDYLSLDVEGAETFIMREFPFDRYQFRCMTVERPKDELKSLFAKNGYKHVLNFQRGDTLWAHESVYEEGKKFTSMNPNEITHHKVDESSMPGFT